MDKEKQEKQLLEQLDEKFLAQSDQSYIVATTEYSREIEQSLDALIAEEMQGYDDIISMLKERLDLTKDFLKSGQLTPEEKRYYYEELKSIQFEIENIYLKKNEAINENKKEKHKTKVMLFSERITHNTITDLTALGKVIASIIKAYNAAAKTTIEQLEIKESFLKLKSKIATKKK